MKTTTKIAVFCLIPIGLLLAWFGIVTCLFLFARDKSGTDGDRINVADNPNSALLTIDLMNYATRRNSGILNVFVDQKRADVLIESNNAAIDHFREKNVPIIFIYQAFEKRTLKSLFITWVSIKGSFKSQFDSRLHKQTADPEFNKPHADAFSNPELQTYLNNKKIGTLFITGTAAEGCVYMTIWGARKRGYRVQVIDEAVYPFEPEKKEVIFSKYRALGAKIITLKDLTSMEVDG